MTIFFAAFALFLPESGSDFQSYRAHIEAASNALSRNNSRLAKQWLTHAPKKYRGWEWNYLSSQSDSSVASISASNEAITKVQVSPDGKLLAVASADSNVSLWDTQTLARLGTLKGHTNSVFGLSFSSDGKRILTTSRDKTVRLWDAKDFREIGVLGEHPVTPYNAAFTPDGKKVVSVGWRTHPDKKTPVGLIRVWDVETKKMLHDMDYTTHPLSSVTFSKDGMHCYIGCWEYQVAEMDMVNYKVQREVKPKESSSYKAVDWVEIAPNGKQMITACKDKTVRIFDLPSGNEVSSLTHQGQVSSARFSPEGKWIVSTSQDGAVRIWDAASMKQITTLLGHDQPINCAAITPDGKLVFSGDVSGRVMVWDTTDARTYSPSYEVDGAWSCVFSPDSTRIATGTNLRTIQIRHSGTGELLKSSPVYKSLVIDVAWSPDGKRVVAGSNDGTVRCFDSDSMVQLWMVTGNGQFRAIDWSSDGKYVTSGAGGSGIASVWESVSGQLIFETRMEPGTLNVAFAPDAKRVAFASMRTLQIHEIPSGKILKQIKSLSSEAYEVAFAPDGKSVAVGESAGHLELFDSKSLTRKWSQKTDGSQWGVHFSPDGKRIASTGYDFATHLWDPASGLEVFAIRDLPTQGFDVRFSPDGTRLAHMGGTGIIWILDQRPFRNRKTN
jgi:WD40 repeat protein